MKSIRSSAANEFPMWGGLTVVILLIITHVVGLSLFCLGRDDVGMPLDYEKYYRQREESEHFLYQLNDPSHQRLGNTGQSSTELLRADVADLRHRYEDLSYQQLFAGKTIHRTVSKIPVVWLASMFGICSFLSLSMSFFGVLILKPYQMSLGNRKGTSRPVSLQNEFQPSCLPPRRPSHPIEARENKPHTR